MLNFAEKPHVTVSKVFRVTLAEEKNTTDFSLGSEDAFIVLLDSTKGSMKPLFIFYSKDPIFLSFPFQEKKEHWLTVQVPDNFENNTNTSVKLTYTKKEEWIDPRHQKMEIGEKTSEKVVTRYDGQYPEYVTLFSYTITLDLLATIQESLDIN
ncbi:hypothetical protein [Endozoicomonas sp. Mp262]|uniref:hypothetical protein n=1 Tax=Endozoicomonas sp. Mp262 TaxID=2919499 RepID=UPI0021DB62EC